MLKILCACVAIAAAGLVPREIAAKPIAFQQGYSGMSEYGAGTMQEVQLFYAPRYWWSAGPGFLRLNSEDGQLARNISYLRGNLLVQRWNLPQAQGNVFAWGSLGGASGSDFTGTHLAGNAGAQLDYETLRYYGSLRSEFHYSSAYAHRIDTLQVAWAPYAHDWDRLATWLLLQARGYTGGLYEGTETALMLRFFGTRAWGSAWLELGATQDGAIQSMLMFNF